MVLQKENKQSFFKRIYKKSETKKVYLLLGFICGIIWALMNSIIYWGDLLAAIIGCLFYIPINIFIMWTIAKLRLNCLHLDKERYEEEKKVDLVPKKQV